MRQFGLKKLIFGTGEDICVGSGDGGDEMVNGDGLAVERSLLVSVRGQLNGIDRSRRCAGLLRQDGPEIPVVVADAESEQGFKRAGVEVGEEDGGCVRVKACCGAAATSGDVEQLLCLIGRGGYVDGLAVDDCAQLDVVELVGG